MLQLISSCSNYSRPCADSADYIQKLVADARCNCPDTIQDYDDYGVCVDDKAYFISPFSVVKFHTKGSDNWSKLYRLRI
jgi:hypothetical protein